MGKQQSKIKNIKNSDPNFTISADSTSTNKALKSDPGFYFTPKGEKNPKTQSSDDAYVQFKKGGIIKTNKNMSLNKGKAKVKTKSKSTAKTAGTKKKAVLNSRNPKKPMAISGDTMSNYAMYKKGGTTKKKYEVGGDSANSNPDTVYYRVKNKKNGVKEKEISEKRYRRIENRLTNRPGTTGYETTEVGAFNGMNVDTEGYMNKAEKKGIKAVTPRLKKGGMTKAKKFAALAPPYNKATAADRIAGAKKNSKNK